MIDIISDGEYPADTLSNFYPHPFIFRGIECASMEGLLQSVKFKDPAEQLSICQLVGKAAKERGSIGNVWQEAQTLWWQGVAMARASDTYQAFLDEAFSNLFTQNMEAQTALIASEDHDLLHTIGVDDPRETVLTSQEFCQRLMGIRDVLYGFLSAS